MNIYSTLGQQSVIPSASPTSTDKTAEQIAKEKAEKEKIDFLNLLLTQLSNQNPLDPMDTKDFTAQLTRYSILEQGIETNEKLAVTNDLLKSSSQAASFSYIGKRVEVETNMNTVHDNNLTWSYLVDGKASDVKLTVTDEAGNRIGEYDGSVAQGVQTFSLDTTGSNLAEGQTLYFSVNATNSEGDKMKSRTTAQIVVDGVWSDQKQSFLTAGGLSFRASDVLKIVEEGQTAAAPTPPADDEDPTT